ncbi:MAG: M28 family peptidase [Proteobacteria bacterium]|nr:M28 family peptidase [Pseudomonadota bacterium]
MIRMPGTSYRGVLPQLTGQELTFRTWLRRDVETLAGQIGERNLYQYAQLQQAAAFIAAELGKAGYAVGRQSYQVEGRLCENLEVQLTGSGHAEEIVIIGAHYDSVFGSPGANDNASGVAALLTIARALAEIRPARTLRFVAFVNEEPFFFQTDSMGSVVYAQRSRARRERIVAMLSLETIGYYTEARGSQHYPLPLGLFYPSTGNFIGFVGNLGSGKLVRQVVGLFRQHAKFPSEGVAMPGWIPGVGWSDHWAFWREGYPGVMVTDTAPYRYPHYHAPSDTPDKLDYDRLARIFMELAQAEVGVPGIARVVIQASQEN